MNGDEKISDKEWLQNQRLESDRRAWLWSRLKSFGSWIVGSLTALWAFTDALTKLFEWIHKR